MMIRVLSVLLAAQLVLTVILYWPRDTERGAPPSLVTAFGAAEVAQLRIDDGDETVTLRRDGDDGWRMEDGLPADGGKVEQLLDALTASDPGYAIARSDGAARRFEVADDSFERRVELSTGDATAIVFLGTSPAFRKIHARAADSNAVHVLRFNSYDAPAAAAGWLDRGLLAMRNVSRIGDGDLDLRLDDGEWRRGGDGDVVDADAVDALVQGLASLRVTGLASDADREAAAAGEERARLSVTGDGGAVQIAVIASDERYFLRSSAHDALFPTSAYDAERLLDALATLRGDSAEADEAESVTGAGGDAAGTDGAGG